MSDQSLRDRERRWIGIRTVESEATYLLQSVRQGLLALENLELASYLGHPAAVYAVKVARPPRTLNRRLLRIRDWGRDASVRAATAIASRVVKVVVLDDATVLHALVRSYSEWLSNPSTELVDRITGIQATIVDKDHFDVPVTKTDIVSYSVKAAGQDIVDRSGAWTPGSPHSDHRGYGAVWAGSWAARLVKGGQATVWRELRADLLGWLLPSQPFSSPTHQPRMQSDPEPDA